MGMTEGNEATAYERCYEVDRELEPAWLAVRGVQAHQGRRGVVPLNKARQHSRVVQYDR
jgi:hypothetical protein